MEDQEEPSKSKETEEDAIENEMEQRQKIGWKKKRDRQTNRERQRGRESFAKSREATKRRVAFSHSFEVDYARSVDCWPARSRSAYNVDDDDNDNDNDDAADMNTRHLQFLFNFCTGPTLVAPLVTRMPRVYILASSFRTPRTLFCIHVLQFIATKRTDVGTDEDGQIHTMIFYRWQWWSIFLWLMLGRILSGIWNCIWRWNLSSLVDMKYNRKVVRDI